MGPGIASLSHEMALEGWDGPGAVEAPSDRRLAAIVAAGSDLWLDTGDREAARRLWRSEFSGLTTNNTLANQVVQTGAFDELIRAAAQRLRGAGASLGRDELVTEIGFIVNCRIALRLVATFGVQVSVELHPSLANDVDESVLLARRYYSVCPEHFLIKIPLTPAGYCAAARLASEGVAVNFTLGFSARQNYLAALLARPQFVNVFLGRLNAVVADNGLGDGRNVGEKATLASARAVTEIREARPAIATRQIAASMRAPSQMTDLAGVDVQTIPPTVAEEFLAGDTSPGDIGSQLERDPEVEVKAGVSAEEVGLNVLWEVDEATRATADDLLRANMLKLTAEDLIRASENHGAGLFHRFTRDEEAAVAAKGKIPDLSRWQGRVALDDLMTRSGLLSFTADQQKLDDRIRSLIG